MKKRLDVYMFENSLANSRQKAQTLIKSGKVTVNGSTVTKAGFTVDDNDCVAITGEVCEFVGRGGLKLKKAIQVFEIDVSNKVCIDIGASTGGFTDCLLQNGASYVYAVDVGHDQLDKKLISDSRVKNLEGINIREISCELFDKPISLAVCDVSFISLKLVLPHIKRLLINDAQAVVLVKPQFEAGKENVKKGGIVKDKKAHVMVLNQILDCCVQLGFSILGLDYSPIQGGSGNIEYLLYLSSNSSLNNKTFDIKNVVENAFTQHNV